MSHNLTYTYGYTPYLNPTSFLYIHHKPSINKTSPKFSMKAISLPNQIFSGTNNHRRSQTAVFGWAAKSYVVKARRGTDDGGNLVDENMIVLRMRIKELEIEERGGLGPQADKWMEWEKKYYGSYIGDVCEAMMMLQMCLMNTRPSLALGTLTFLMLSVPLSTSVVIYNFISWFNSLL
ncbi:hypothetical protein Hanom_Chr11g00973861 [Helianthus anomalus]